MHIVALFTVRHSCRFQQRLLRSGEHDVSPAQETSKSVSCRRIEGRGIPCPFSDESDGFQPKVVSRGDSIPKQIVRDRRWENFSKGLLELPPGNAVEHTKAILSVAAAIRKEHNAKMRFREVTFCCGLVTRLGIHTFAVVAVASTRTGVPTTVCAHHMRTPDAADAGTLLGLLREAQELLPRDATLVGVCSDHGRNIAEASSTFCESRGIVDILCFCRTIHLAVTSHALPEPPKKRRRDVSSDDEDEELPKYNPNSLHYLLPLASKSAHYKPPSPAHWWSMFDVLTRSIADIADIQFEEQIKIEAALVAFSPLREACREVAQTDTTLAKALRIYLQLILCVTDRDLKMFLVDRMFRLQRGVLLECVFVSPVVDWSALQQEKITSYIGEQFKKQTKLDDCTESERCARNAEITMWMSCDIQRSAKENPTPCPRSGVAV